MSCIGPSFETFPVNANEPRPPRRGGSSLWPYAGTMPLPAAEEDPISPHTGLRRPPPSRREDLRIGVHTEKAISERQDVGMKAPARSNQARLDSAWPYAASQFLRRI